MEGGRNFSSVLRPQTFHRGATLNWDNVTTGRSLGYEAQTRYDGAAALPFVEIPNVRPIHLTMALDFGSDLGILYSRAAS